LVPAIAGVRIRPAWKPIFGTRWIFFRMRELVPLGRSPAPANPNPFFRETFRRVRKRQGLFRHARPPLAFFPTSFGGQ